MGTATKKKRPMRSRRSGVKKLALVKSNLSTLKKLAALFMVVLLFACETPYKVIQTTTTDSTGKTTIIKQKYYLQGEVSRIQPSVNVVTSPLWYQIPYYTPYIVPQINIPYRMNNYRGSGRHH